MDKNSDTFKRGIDTILKSDQYTDEYKKVLLEQLGTDYSDPKTEPQTQDVNFDLLKNGGLVVTESSNTGSLITVTEKPAAVSGYIEKPKYLEDELTKAVDVEVDELINLPPKQKSLTVPKETYDDLQLLYDKSISDLEDLRDELNRTISDLETANLAINLLNQTVDSEKILRASADNEAQASTDRYTAVLGDFQTAMQKAIQEAIERVSLTAQVRGLQAQKEVLKEQLKQMTVIVENLQQSVEESADLLSDQQEAQAASFLLTGKEGTFGKESDSGWKIPSGNVGSRDTGKWPLWHRKGAKPEWQNGTTVDFYNLSEEDLIFTFTYVKEERVEVKGSNQSKPFISGPNSITVSPRVESTPGKTSVDFKKIIIWNATRTARVLNRSSYANDTIQVTVSNGETFNIGAKYQIRY